jgi:hypothetical protein
VEVEQGKRVLLVLVDCGHHPVLDILTPGGRAGTVKKKENTKQK